MTHVVFVDGQEGTTGLRIHEYLAQRADIEVLRISPERRKDAAERARLLNAARLILELDGETIKFADPHIDYYIEELKNY